MGVQNEAGFKRQYRKI